MPEKDDSQFVQLFLRHQPRLYSAIRAQVLNRVDAEDVLQEVATVLWRRFDEYETGTHFDRWALKIAKLQVLKYFEKRRYKRLIFDSDVQELIYQVADEANVNLDDQRDALEKCIGKLPEADRKIIRLRFESEATNREVARELGKSDSAISRSLNRIYVLLLNCIQLQLSPRFKGGDA